jgi:hypothetical protein
LWRGLDQFQRHLMALTGFDQHLHIDPRPRPVSARTRYTNRCAS